MILDGPDSVELYPEVVGEDGYGTEIRKPGSTPITVRGRMQPAGAGNAPSSSEQVVSGQQVETTYRFIARSIPVGPWAKAVWGGREWKPTGEIARRGYSPATSHDTVTLRALTPEEP